MAFSNQIEFCDFLRIVKDIFASNVEMIPPRFQKIVLEPEVRLKEDLGIDSLGLVMLVCDLQLRFPQLDASRVETWRTLSDCFADCRSAAFESADDAISAS
jgi:acyl carrier protein